MYSNPWGSLPQFGQQQPGQMQPQMQRPMGFGQMPPQMTPPIMQGMPGQQPSGQMPMMGGPYAQVGHQQRQPRGMFGMPDLMQRFSGMMGGMQMPQFNGGGLPFMNRQGG